MKINGKGGAVQAAPPDNPLLDGTYRQTRQVMYRFLGALFLYPTRDRLRSARAVADALLQETQWWTHLPFGETAMALFAQAANLDSEDALSLEEEYTRLFQVRPAAVPCESFYTDREGLAYGLIIAHLAGEYQAAGLELAEGIVEPPDHVAVELEFMAFLCDREAESVRDAIACETAVYRDRQRQFLDRHFRRWFPAFARRARSADPAPLYRLTLEATFAFLLHELALFGLYTKSRQPDG